MSPKIRWRATIKSRLVARPEIIAVIGVAAKDAHLVPQCCPLANKNAAQCVERLLRGSCGAALGHLAKGGRGPFVKLCKGHYLRISDLLAIQEVNADPSGLRTNILSQIQPNH